MQPYRLVMVVARLRVSQTRGLEGFIQTETNQIKKFDTSIDRTKRQNGKTDM
jgi:hypothetical protein